MLKYAAFSGGSLRKSIFQGCFNGVNGTSLVSRNLKSNVRESYRSVSSLHLVPVTCSSQRSLDLYDEAINQVSLANEIIF